MVECKTRSLKQRSDIHRLHRLLRFAAPRCVRLDQRIGRRERVLDAVDVKLVVAREILEELEEPRLERRKLVSDDQCLDTPHADRLDEGRVNELLVVAEGGRAAGEAFRPVARPKRPAGIRNAPDHEIGNRRIHGVFLWTVAS